MTQASKMPLQIIPREIRVSDHLSLLQWKRQLRAILLTEDAWKVICGEMDKPTHQDPTDKTFRRDLDKWRKLNNVALGWMLLTLEDFSRQSIERFTEPLDAMESLFKKFTPPFMTFREFVGKVDPLLPAAPSTPMMPTVLVERSNGRVTPSDSLKFKPRKEFLRVGSHNASNLWPNRAGIVEALHRRRTPHQDAKDDATLTPNGIHNIVTRRELSTPTLDRTRSQATFLRKGLMEKITGSKPPSPHPESDRASLTLYRAEFSRGELPHPDTFESDIDATQNDSQSCTSAFTDSNVVIPDRGVSLVRSDLSEDGTAKRHRGPPLKTGRHSCDALFEEGPYMMSGALQD